MFRPAKLIAFAVLLIGMVPGLARAADVLRPELDEKPAGASVTYGDILKNANIEGVASVEAFLVKDGSKVFAVLLADPLHVLALARVAPDYRHLDTLDVAQDMHVNVSEEPGLVSLGPGLAAFVVTAWHLNAGEEFRNKLLIGVHDGRLRVLYDGPSLYSFVEYGEGTRSCRVAQQDRWEVLPTASGGNRDLKLSVVEERLCGEIGSEKVVSRKPFTATLRWDPVRKKYMGGSKDLFRLNRRRIGQ